MFPFYSLSLRAKSKILPTSLVRRRLSAAAQLRIAKAFWSHQHCWGYSNTIKTAEAILLRLFYLSFYFSLEAAFDETSGSFAEV